MILLILEYLYSYIGSFAEALAANIKHIGAQSDLLQKNKYWRLNC
jgi:hypothetical protein